MAIFGRYVARYLNLTCTDNGCYGSMGAEDMVLQRLPCSVHTLQLLMNVYLNVRGVTHAVKRSCHVIFHIKISTRRVVVASAFFGWINSGRLCVLNGSAGYARHLLNPGTSVQSQKVSIFHR